LDLKCFRPWASRILARLSDQFWHGVKLEDETVIEAPVVVNAAGSHSFIINRLAGVEDGMKIKTKALRHDVVHLPAPPGVDHESIGCPISDSDIGAYWRSEMGNHR